MFKCLCDLSLRTVDEFCKQEEVLLERNYVERAAAIDGYCSYSDLLDQSQSGKLFHLHTYVCIPIAVVVLHDSPCISLLSYSKAVQAVEETYRWTVDWRLSAALCHQHRDVF